MSLKITSSEEITLRMLADMEEKHALLERAIAQIKDEIANPPKPASANVDFKAIEAEVASLPECSEKWQKERGESLKSILESIRREDGKAL